MDLNRYFCTQKNIRVYSVQSSRQAIGILHFTPPDIIMLGTDLLDIDGIQLCCNIRKASEIPIIIVSERNSEEDRLAGLAAGADDYVVKPYNVRELAARIRVVLRRSEHFSKFIERKRDMIEVGNLTIDRSRFIVLVNGRDVKCTPKELEILWLLASNPGMVFSREQILNSVWGNDYSGSNRVVDTQILHLRTKLDDPTNNWKISTLHGIGYRFELI